MCDSHISFLFDQSSLHVPDKKSPLFDPIGSTKCHHALGRRRSRHRHRHKILPVLLAHIASAGANRIDSCALNSGNLELKLTHDLHSGATLNSNQRVFGERQLRLQHHEVLPDARLWAKGEGQHRAWVLCCFAHAVFRQDGVDGAA